MNKKFHIAQIIDSLGEGGAERLLLTFSEAALARGIKVTVISLSDDAKYYPSSMITRDLKAMGVAVISLDSRKLYNPRPLLELLKIFRRERFDIIQTHLSHGCILGGIAGWLAGIPVISTLHNPSPRRIGHYRIREFIWEFVLKYLSKRVIAVGTIVRDAYASKLPSEKIDLVLNAVREGPVISSHEREIIRREIAGDTTSRLIFCVGRMVAGKGLSELLAAFSRVRADYPDLLLIFIGDGDLKAQTIKDAEQKKIVNSIRFLGIRNDVQRLLACGDLYISASYSEGMSIALLEAMMAGLPIVATSVGEAPYLLADNRGVLIPPRDTEALVSGLRLMLDDPASMREMGDAVQIFTKENCSPGVWLDRLVTVYSRVIGKTGWMGFNVI